MVRRVDAAARIAVDVPSPADIGVLLDDQIANAKAPKSHTERNGADPGSHDEDSRALDALLRWTGAPVGIPRNDAHLLADHRSILRRHALAQTSAHHALHHIIAGIRHLGRP